MATSPAALELVCRVCGQASPADQDAQSWQCSCRAAGSAYLREAGIWRIDELEPQGFDRAARERLASCEEGHFWFEAREQLLLQRLARHQSAPRHALDLGCGNGRFLGALAGLGAAVTGIDAYVDGLERALARVPAATLLAADITQVPLPDASFDVISLLDVLEHLEPAPLLAEARRLLKSDGHLLVAVPASPAVWSDLDRLAGHRLRYRRRQLQGELAAHGFDVLDITAYQCLLFPLVWLSRKFDRRPDQALERRPPGWIGRILGAINRLEVACCGRLDLPWGSSLIAVARKSERKTS